MAETHKDKTLLYTCTTISTILIVLIALNIFGILTLPGSESNDLPNGARQFDLKYFLTFTLFPVLVFLNLALWTFTTVSGTVFQHRRGVKLTMQLVYSLITLGLLVILVFRFI